MQPCFALPKHEEYVFDTPWDGEEGEWMEFRLVFIGDLPSHNEARPRASEKHLIRKSFHHQLKNLWDIKPPMSRWKTQVVAAANSPSGIQSTVLQVMADQHNEYGFRFVPLATKQRSLHCEINILFLRKDQPGGIVSAHGDIDNRLKLIFDGLRKPDNANEIPKGCDFDGDDPVFVLLEDDRLITKVSITTDRLLESSPASGPNHAHVIVGVKIAVVDVSPMLSNLEFL